MSSSANTNANSVATPFVRDYLPGTAPQFGKRGSFAAHGESDPGGALMSFGAGGGFVPYPYPLHDLTGGILE